MTEHAHTLAVDHDTPIGAALRAARRALKVSTSSASQAAGISRVTLHRIEKGDASVSMGAYLRVADALGVRLGVADAGVAGDQSPNKAPQHEPAPLGPIAIDDYPQLKLIAWSTPDVKQIEPHIALGLYERNWRYVDQPAMQAHERALLNRLIQEYGNGCLFV